MLSACSEVVEKQAKEIQLSDLALTQSLDRVQHLETQVQDKDKALGAWYRNGFFMLALGLVAGVALTK